MSECESGANKDIKPFRYRVSYDKFFFSPYIKLGIYTNMEQIKSPVDLLILYNYAELEKMFILTRLSWQLFYYSYNEKKCNRKKFNL